MRITVILKGPLQKYQSGAGMLEMPPGSLLRDVLAFLPLPGAASGLLLVNGVKAAPGQELRDGDRVTIYPPVCGG